MTRTSMRLLGGFICLGGIAGSAYMWHSVLTRGVYWPKASFIFPFFACLGLSVFLYPMTKAECVENFGSKNMPWKHMPPGQKILVIFGVLLGALQVGFFSGKLPI